jgi:hypothetical protein
VLIRGEKMAKGKDVSSNKAGNKSGKSKNKAPTKK